jgi:hypothetical protein
MSNYIERFNKENVDKLLSLDTRQLLKLLYPKDSNPDEEHGLGHLWGFKNNEDYVRQLLLWLNAIKANEYSMEGKYQLTACGRQFAVGFNLQKCKSNLRGCLQQGISFDYDMKNAHPTLLLYLIETTPELKGLDGTYIKEYVESRQVVLQQHGLTKLDVLKTMNRDRLYKCQNSWLKAFHESLKPVKDVLYKIHQADANPSKKNPKSSLMNQLLCREENRVLMKAVRAIQENGGKVGTLVFDGFQCEQNTFVELINSTTAEEKIEWIIKPYQALDLAQVQLKELLSYQQMKKEFEKNHFIVLNPLSYCSVMTESNEPVVYRNNKADFKNMYEPLQCDKGPFLREWFQDGSRREYRKFDFIPPPLDCPSYVYNLFTSFKYQSYEVEPDEDIDIFLNHVRLLAGDEHTDDVYQYLLNYLAQLIQSPGILPEVAIVMKSVQGIGKNLFFESFGREVLGDKYLLSTSKSEHVLGRFNLINCKFLVCYDEVKGTDTYKANNTIKEFITTNHIDWEQKCKDAVRLPNFMRMMFFSNTESPVKIELTDRRFQVIECSRNKGTKEYYDALAAAWKNKAKVLGFVNYLKSRDLAGWRAKSCRIQTSLHEALASGDLSHYDKFLRDALYTRGICFAPDKMRPLDFYHRYEKWISKKDWSSQTNTAFGRAMKKYNGISKIKVKGLLYYRINFDELTRDLFEKKIINEDEREGILRYGSDDEIELE